MLYQDIRHLPLLETIKETQETEHFVFEEEKRHTIFWWVWDHTLGFLLGWFVRKRTERIIYGKLSKENRQKWKTVEGKRKILSGVRNFDDQGKFRDLFLMRTPFLTKGSAPMQYFLYNVNRGGALDVAYNVNGGFAFWQQPVMPRCGVDFMTKFYLNFPNAQAVRNRYRIVVQAYLERGGNALSIACGSAQPLIHAFALKADSLAHLMLTDASEEALALARETASWAKLPHHKVSTRKIQWNKLNSAFSSNRKFHFVEACGILDYLSPKISIALVKKMLEVTEEGGTIIVSNVVPTRHEKVLSKLFNWNMVYKKPEELKQIVEEAGGKNVQVQVEPWGIHAVVTATRG